MQKIILLTILLIGIPFNIYIWISTSSDKSNIKPTTVKPQIINNIKETGVGHKNKSYINYKIIGGKRIAIPSPDGWYEISNKNPDFFKTFEKMTLAPNRLVAAFLPKNDNENPDFNRYMLITASKDVEKMPNIPHSDFRWFKSQIKERQNILAMKFRSRYGNGSLRNLDNSSIKFKIGEMTPLGVFIDKSNAIATATIMSTETKINQDTVYNNVVVGAATLRVNGKMFNVQVLSKYEAYTDIIWMKGKANELVDLIFEAN